MLRTFLLMVAVTLTVGCGSTAAHHRALDVLAATVNPSYSLAIESCFAAEDIVIARQGTTEEQDSAAMESIRSTCDRVFGAFDSLRIAHRLARSAVDGGGEALVSTALQELHSAWAALRQVLPEIERLV